MSPRLYRCTVPGISVQFANGGRTFAVGELVDLDAPATGGKDWVITWRQALGDYADTFEPVGEAPTETEETP